MDLNGSLKVLASLHHAHHDVTDPISVMPKDVRFIELMYEGKRVNIKETVKLFFEKPSFVCTDVRRFWELLIENPEEYVIDVAKEFRSPIITK
jgi:hypothetical protein